MQAICRAQCRRRCRSCDVYLLAGSLGKPITDRYARPAEVRSIDFATVEQRIKTMTQAVGAHPFLNAYYISDEYKPFMFPGVRRAVELYAAYDPVVPAVPLGWYNLDQLPIAFTHAGYAFGHPSKGRYNALAYICDYADEVRQITDAPQWQFIPAYSTNSSFSRMPTPAEMEAQVYLLLSGGVIGIYTYSYANLPQWQTGEENLVDSLFLPNPTMERLTAISGDLHSFGDLLASSEYLSDADVLLTAEGHVRTDLYHHRSARSSAAGAVGRLCPAR